MAAFVTVTFSASALPTDSRERLGSRLQAALFAFSSFTGIGPGEGKAVKGTETVF